MKTRVCPTSQMRKPRPSEGKSLAQGQETQRDRGHAVLTEPRWGRGGCAWSGRAFKRTKKGHRERPMPWPGHPKARRTDEAVCVWSHHGGPAAVAW